MLLRKLELFPSPTETTPAFFGFPSSLEPSSARRTVSRALDPLPRASASTSREPFVHLAPLLAALPGLATAGGRAAAGAVAKAAEPHEGSAPLKFPAPPRTLGAIGPRHRPLEEHAAKAPALALSGASRAVKEQDSLLHNESPGNCRTSLISCPTPSPAPLRPSAFPSLDVAGPSAEHSRGEGKSCEGLPCSKFWPRGCSLRKPPAAPDCELGIGASLSSKSLSGSSLTDTEAAAPPPNLRFAAASALRRVLAKGSAPTGEDVAEPLPSPVSSKATLCSWTAPSSSTMEKRESTPLSEHPSDVLTTFKDPETELPCRPSCDSRSSSSSCRKGDAAAGDDACRAE